MNISALPSETKASDLLELELQAIVNSCWMWLLGTKLGSLQEQNVLLAAKPSLWLSSHIFGFFFKPISSHGVLEKWGFR